MVELFSCGGVAGQPSATTVVTRSGRQVRAPTITSYKLTDNIVCFDYEDELGKFAAYLL
jgi:hypothetical protein